MINKDLILSILGACFTIIGIILILKNDLTNGLLAIIAGELIDLPIRIAKRIK